MKSDPSDPNMGVIIKQSTTSTIITYIGVGIGYINVLILFPKYMTPDEVGLARIIQDFAILMVPFAQLGIGQITVRYFPAYHKEEYYSHFVGMVFSLLVVSLGIFTSLFFLFRGELSSYFAEQSPQVIDYLGTILVLIIIMSLYQLMVAFSNSSLNIVLPNFLKEVWLRLLTAILLLLFAFSYINFNQFIFILVLCYAGNLLILAAYLFATKKIKLAFSFSYFKWDILRPMIKFGLITFLGASGFLIIGKVDSIMVTGMLGLTENAIYSTAFYIAVLIELPRRALSQIGMPVISRAFENNNLEEVETIYKKSALNNLIIGSLIFIGLWINLSNLYALIPNSEVYSLGSSIVLIIGAGKLFDMSAGLNGEIIVMSKYYKFNVYSIILLSIVTITANYLLIPILGLAGAALGSTFALVLFNLVKYIFLYYRYQLQPFSWITIRVILLAAATLLLGLYLPKIENVYIDIIYRSAVVTLFYTVLVYNLKLSTDIVNMINSAIGRRNEQNS